ncbi:transposase [Rhodococcus globerulus]|uniref:transposase n=1 Tax=Rhodococcus globerulus TaxID=33008 RepID=UPI00301938E1
MGIDSHKSTHTATALEPATNTDLGSLRIEATLTEYTRLLTWSKNVVAADLGDRKRRRSLPPSRAMASGGGGIGPRHSPTATARVRQLSKGSRRKNDRIDAAAAASVAAVQGDARPCNLNRLPTSSPCWTNVETTRPLPGRRINFMPCCGNSSRAAFPPSSPRAERQPHSPRIKPRTAIDSMRMRLRRDLIADLKRYDTQLADNHRELAPLLDELGTSLRDVPGVGTILAGRLIGRTGIAHRFPTAAAFATYN